MLQVLLINAAIIYDTTLSDNVALIREGWDIFISTHLYQKITSVISSHNGSDKVYIFQCKHYLPCPSTKTKKVFYIGIPLGVPSVDIKIVR